MYIVKTPWWLRALYPSLIWRLPAAEKVIYLTFDDGPHEIATPFVLDVLKQYNAKATFFCIGKNVLQHAEIYAQVIAEGHAVGNHTAHHANGWKVDDEKYMQEITEAAECIHSNLFRPPYGRIKRSQIKQLQKRANNNSTLQSTKLPFKIIMWDILSGDFDVTLGKEVCYKNVVSNTVPGAIIVFHDSAKAWDRLSYALPLVMEYFTKKGYRFEAIQFK